MPKVIYHGETDEEKSEEVDQNWIKTKQSNYEVYIGLENEKERSKLTKVTALFDVMTARAPKNVVHLFPKQQKGTVTKTLSANVPKPLFTWLASQGVRNVYLNALIDAVKSRKGFISSTAKNCLLQMKTHSLMRINNHADPGQEFLILVDMSSNSHYVYVDYRFLALHHESKKQKQLVEKGINAEHYYDSESIRTNNPLAFKKPGGKNTWVGCKYYELVTWASPVDVLVLEDLLRNPETIPGKLVSDQANWKACLWASVFGLAECARHPEWYYLGLIALDLVKSGQVSLGQVINGVEGIGGSGNGCYHKMWPPQATGAVAAMNRAKGHGMDENNDVLYAQACSNLLGFWLGCCYQRAGQTLPTTQPEWDRFGLWATMKILTFVNGHHHGMPLIVQDRRD